MPRRIRLQEALEIETESGNVFRLEPAGDGFSIHPAVGVAATPARTRRHGGGRRPGPETLALRERLEGDAEAGRLDATAVYLKWFQSENPDLGDGAARQRVQNERKRVLDAYPGLKVTKRTKKAKKRRRASQATGSPRGRRPKQSTLELRERLQADAAEGRLVDAGDYVTWLVQRDPEVKEDTARQRVYKERRAVLEDHPELRPKRMKRAKKANGKRGSPALEPLRAKLREDAGRDLLGDTREYVKFAMDHDEKLGLKPARAMVAREKRAAALQTMA